MRFAGTDIVSSFGRSIKDYGKTHVQNHARWFEIIYGKEKKESCIEREDTGGNHAEHYLLLFRHRQLPGHRKIG